MDSLDFLDIVKVIEEQVQKHEPQIIVTHHFGDLNIDHKIIHNAVVTAARPQPDSQIKRILTFETLSSTEWQSISQIYLLYRIGLKILVNTLMLRLKPYPFMLMN